MKASVVHLIKLGDSHTPSCVQYLVAIPKLNVQLAIKYMSTLITRPSARLKITSTK